MHDYLGMDLDYSEKGKVKISIVTFLKICFSDFPEVVIGGSPTPATERLFEVRPDDERKLLEEERAIAFHHSVAHLLFIAIRCRHDIQTAVAFLTTRVKTPDEDDWVKLKRLMKYLKSTVYLKLALEADNLTLLKWWVDAAYAVHPD